MVWLVASAGSDPRAAVRLRKAPDVIPEPSTMTAPGGGTLPESGWAFVCVGSAGVVEVAIVEEEELLELIVGCGVLEVLGVVAGGLVKMTEVDCVEELDTVAGVLVADIDIDVVLVVVLSTGATT
jgi:hypothetical protein